MTYRPFMNADEGYIATSPQYPSLSWIANTRREALGRLLIEEASRNDDE